MPSLQPTSSNESTKHIPSMTEIDKPEPIAIVGIGCRLPGGVSSASECWEFLKEGRDARCEFPPSRFNTDAFYSSRKGTPGTLPMRGGYFLEQDIRQFDNGFFGVNNLEATHMDPQQRNLLEVVYECLESAGMRLEDVAASNIGCYVGDFVYDFLVMQAKDDEDFHRYSPTGKGRTILANRISHVFDLRGPSMTLDTACSSSLYCLHVACRALLQGDCDAAIVASANLVQTPEQQMDVAASGVLSPTSTCHTFDAAADGYGRADAVGALYIKRLSDAIRDNDPIRSIIRATSTNSNGQTPGITLPSAECQETVIKKAYDFASLNHKETDYFECHGTGTPVGDPIEVAAVASFHNGLPSSDEPRTLIVGSTKPSFGHSEASSGITSVIKATLALEHLQIPATVGIKTLNPKIPWKQHNIEVAQSLIPWPRTNKYHIPRVSINSFGYGGANAHCVLDQADAWTNQLLTLKSNREAELLASSTSILHEHDNEQAFILPFAARDTPALSQQLRNLAHHSTPKDEMSNLAYTLAYRRSQFPWRSFAVVRHSSWLSDFERAYLHEPLHTTDAAQRPLTFVFSGQGAQWPQMGKQLFTAYSTFRNSILQLEYHLLSLPNSPTWSLSTIVFNDISEAIHQPSISQTACTALQIALVDLLRDWNIRPEAVVGHSSGEIAAAYAAGHISATYAIEIAYLRGQVVSKNTILGSMMAVSMTAKNAQDLIDVHGLADSVCVACHNSPENMTLSGDEKDITLLYNQLQRMNAFARKLKTGHQAYHSNHMKKLGPIYESLLQDAKSRDDNGCCPFPKQQAEGGPPDVLMMSTVLGRVVSKADTSDPAYWRANLESPVLFSDAITHLVEEESHTFVEIGPHHAMKMPVQQTEANTRPSGTTSIYVSALVRGTCAELTALSLAGRLWTYGYSIDLEAVRRSYRWSNKARPKALHNLPNYPWDHSKILWKEPRASTEYRNRKYPRDELIGSRMPGLNGRTAMWRGLLDVGNVSWIMDHKLGDNVVMPGACYLSMAIRACHQLMPGRLEPDVLQLCDVQIEKVLLLKSETRVEIFTTLEPRRLSSVDDYENAWTFNISSFENGRSTRHACGTIEALRSNATVAIPRLPASKELEKQSSRLWYGQFKNSGLAFGTAFQSLSSISVPRKRNEVLAEAELTALDAHVRNEHEKRYPFDIHPIIVDAAFQTGLIATARGSLEELSGRVPVSIGCLQISLFGEKGEYADYKTRASAKIVGPGTAVGQCELFDSSERLVLQVRDVKVAPLQEAEIIASARSTILESKWVPDISMLRQHNSSMISKMLSNFSASRLTQLGPELLSIIELQALLSSDLNILHIGSIHQESFLDLLSDLSPQGRDAVTTYAVGIQDAQNGILCSIATDDGPPLPEDIRVHGKSLNEQDVLYDIVLVDPDCCKETVLPDINLLSNHLKARGVVLSMNIPPEEYTSDSGIDVKDFSFISEEEFSDDEERCSESNEDLVNVELPSPTMANSVMISRHRHSTAGKIVKPVLLVAGDLNHPLNKAIIDLVHSLHQDSRIVTLTDLEAEDLERHSTVIVTAELETALVANATAEQFSKVQLIASNASNILWIGGGGLISAKKPEHCAILGLARSVMAGDPSSRFVVIDIDEPSIDTRASIANIRAVLCNSVKHEGDLEYLQKDGVLHVSRLMPAEPFNHDLEQKRNLRSTSMKLKDAGPCELHIRDPGQFDTLEFLQIFPDNELAPDHIELSVKAVGMNAKDLYTLSGKVDTVEDTCSCEYSGIVTAIGSAVTGFVVGDRVVSSAPGRYRTLERVPATVCYKLQDDEEFADLACVPMVYGTAIHALCNLAKLQKGESVLIHSAAGGVGTSAIRLAKHIGAEIYATVGNDAKKGYLVSQHGLKPERIFNSRDTSFLPGILQATNGAGVDVVLNSLTGARLHASLEACAKFGRFIEIGKRDILDGGNLNMQIFQKGITFSAFDLHELYYSSNLKYRRVYEKLLVDAVDLYRSLGYVASTTASFDVADIGSAFRYFANASRIGKVAITYDNPSSLIPFVSSKFGTRFSADKSYLLVGCLGGLGRSISRYMLQQGARNFTFLGRSGASKPAAAALVSDLESSGASVTVITGDVCSSTDVAKAVSSLTLPLGGVVQAAMGLSEALFPAMTHEAWHIALDPKIRGTWNLHKAISSHESALDFFLLTSSIAGTIGFSTEANYCAANSFLDHFSSYRRSLGLKCSSVALGPVQGAGIVHENPEIENVFFRGGITEISEDDMLCVIDIALTRQQELGHLITGLEPERAKEEFQDAWGMLEPDPRLTIITARLRKARALAQAGGSHPRGSKEDKSGIDPRITAVLSNPDPPSTSSSSSPSSSSSTLLPSILHTILAELLAKLILMDPDKISPSMFLTDVGMDSTLAAQFRTYIFRATGVDVSFVMLMDPKRRMGDLVDVVVEGLGGRDVKEGGKE